MAKANTFIDINRISDKAIIQAFQKFDERSVPPREKAKKYQVKIGDAFYPTKFIIKQALQEQTINDSAGKRIIDFFSKEGTTEKFATERIKPLEDKILEALKSKKPDNRIARICWNDNGWIRPSGKNGKSKKGKSHEAKYGYGHEEWLFNFDKLIDGYHYGFLEPIYKYQDTYAGKKFNILLYSVNCDTKEEKIAGRIREVEALSREEAEKIKAEYVRRGWYSEMIEDIKRELGSDKGFSNYKGVDVFNVRFKPENAKGLDINLKDTNVEISSYRYNLLYDTRSNKSIDEPNEGLILKPFVFGKKYVERTKLGNKTYDRQNKKIQLTHKHKDISVELENYLINKHGKTNVKAENATGKGTSIDIAVKDGKAYIFYEIKTYSELRYSIREAIGQLLEYSYWPQEKNAKELVIVSDQPADDWTKQYMSHLRKLFNLPLYYQQFDLNEKVLNDKV